MSPGQLFILALVPVFASGWFARDIYDHLTKGRPMPKRIVTRPWNALFAWFEVGRRLTGLSVVAALLAVCGFIYVFNADQQSEDRTREVYACLGRYVNDLSSSQAPRTTASVLANDARRDWDRGYSSAPIAKNMSRDELKERYLRLYSAYVDVRSNNPLPVFSERYCNEAAGR